MQFVINGMQVKTDADAGMPLLWFLRDELGLTAPNSAVGQACAEPVPSISMAQLCEDA